MKFGSVYRHFKGGIYEVLHLATLESSLTPVIVYRQLHTDKVWVRPIAEWYELVECNGIQVRRFTELQDHLFEPR